MEKLGLMLQQERFESFPFATFTLLVFMRDYCSWVSPLYDHESIGP